MLSLKHCSGPVGSKFKMKKFHLLRGSKIRGVRWAKSQNIRVFFFEPSPKLTLFCVCKCLFLEVSVNHTPSDILFQIFKLTSNNSIINHKYVTGHPNWDICYFVTIDSTNCEKHNFKVFFNKFGCQPLFPSLLF
jgi:hypothetical protein